MALLKSNRARPAVFIVYLSIFLFYFIRLFRAQPSKFTVIVLLLMVAYFSVLFYLHRERASRHTAVAILISGTILISTFFIYPGIKCSWSDMRSSVFMEKTRYYSNSLVSVINGSFHQFYSCFQSPSDLPGRP